MTAPSHVFRELSYAGHLDAQEENEVELASCSWFGGSSLERKEQIEVRNLEPEKNQYANHKNANPRLHI
ncbi:MAG: hypothetical protein A3H71_00170 [Candidatus Sungbacteria bacterium RIFCSPLOWO2_02_FULL_48_13b]|uniref:Uncharacterized protein n=1 Tax=Candidatus Sungbacteria bacterium RIFCSPLOWO2_02_FULL_48_13b TaxID=1802283 RepID=A0A1G2LJX3_9BACT|nr:MAG: hypothetical protein A3H71_00170 [Candidatus Sungbacteria bacterium RIFCSPLOWO2_02_FULL_48_13b]